MNRRMNIREIAIADIKPAAYNPRKDLKPGDPEYERLASVIDHYGLVEPLVLNERTGNLVGGHQRLKILKARGDSTVQAVVVDLNDSDEKALNVALNKVQGEWDLPLLSQLLQDLHSRDFDLGLTGFSVAELDTLLAPASIGRTDEDTVPEMSARTTTVRGDGWRMGPHRAWCVDSTNADEVRLALKGVVPKIMDTDPPFGTETDPSWRERIWRGARSTGRVPGDDRADWREAWALFPGDIAYIWHAGTKADVVAASLQAAGFEIRGQIIWAKQHFVISRGHYHPQHEPCWYAVRQGRTAHWVGDRKQTTLWEIANRNAFGGSQDDASTFHGTQKPVECMRRPILNHTNIGDVVYDPFLGSGTTLIAAETCRRVCYGIDIDPVYVDLAVRRWEAFTGQKAHLEADGRTFDEVAKDREDR